MSGIKWTAEIEAHTLDDLIDRLRELADDYDLRGRPTGTAIFASSFSKGTVTAEVLP